jgi:phenylpropionate dioxygenase-like ring-hydroxylating dioxygenase large terminal subunit
MIEEPSPPPRAGSSPHHGRFSVVRLARQWYIALESRRLRRRPIAVTILGIPMVVFRDARGVPSAFLDRCPHRNTPLSMGRLRDGELECAYHGWRFAPGGRCVEIPGLAATRPMDRGTSPDAPKRGHEGGDPAGRSATVFPCVEQDGFVWVRAEPGDRIGAEPGEPGNPPPEPPYRIPGLDAPGYGTGRLSYEIEAPLHATLENILDVPHTAFLHGGLFRRSDKRREIEVVVRRRRDRAEAEYIGEARPSGLAGMLLAPGGGEVRHFDRFILPSIAQVEYSLGERSHLIATHVLTPVDDSRTRGFLVVTAKLPVPLWLIRGMFRVVALKLLRQDQAILKAQTENVRRFGGERFASTEIDILGSQIWWLLRRAERVEQGLAPEPGGEAAPESERRIRMRV